MQQGRCRTMDNWGGGRPWDERHRTVPGAWQPFCLSVSLSVCCGTTGRSISPVRPVCLRQPATEAYLLCQVLGFAPPVIFCHVPSSPIMSQPVLTRPSYHVISCRILPASRPACDVVSQYLYLICRAFAARCSELTDLYRNKNPH